ncbi:cytochrome P460 family protein [Sulfurovum sp.]|uniref:cytochrome P460 family protein n=1 Tax=Sulfurovum sp. TaxID=1969726 RepID=UPI00356197D7
MKKSILTSIMIPRLILLSLVLSMIFIPDLFASNTNNKGVIKNQFTFPRWKSLHKLNTEALKSDSHRAWFDIYINTLAKKAYIQKWHLFPVGSIVVKPLYPDPKRSETSKLTIMIKMEKGYDTDNSDWWYGVYDETGMEGWHQGKIKSCIKCHTYGKETDYMFSESVMESINEKER